MFDQGGARHVDMRKAPAEAFANDEDVLRAAPKLLAVHLAGPTYGEAFVNIYDDFSVKWPTGGGIDISINARP